LISADLLYLITKETKHFKFLVEEITQFLINDFFENSGSIVRLEKEQIHVAIRFYDLPIIAEFHFSLQAVSINLALSTFTCIVSSKSKPEQYV
jgi:hypothetical protein